MLKYNLLVAYHQHYSNMAVIVGKGLAQDIGQQQLPPVAHQWQDDVGPQRKLLGTMPPLLPLAHQHSAIWKVGRGRGHANYLSYLITYRLAAEICI